MASLGIYEKATPKNISWQERLQFAKNLGFDFIEMSIDETDDRLARLDWTKEEQLDLLVNMHTIELPILSICLSAHRRFPLGSQDENLRNEALEIMQKAVNLASILGVRVIQLAGYDVYYEEKSELTRQLFIENLKKCVAMAQEKAVMLSIEIMDDPFMSSIEKFMEIKKDISSPYLQVYPDVGNLSAWQENNPSAELEIGIQHITNVHLKDTLAVTDDFPGKFKEVPFGEGCVDFDGLLKKLKALNYNGPFVVEMWSETSENPQQEIEQAKEFILPKLRKVGF
ncbi:MAG: L-ribulose-5-phosphate 3-epimerase [Streptococcaceae bacterium]|jgi:hexulose-6-phosphate isomerase|nr:L-ribulose-5-phosphate 3-epimerase [Streptococcaceae bacterium]